MRSLRSGSVLALAIAGAFACAAFPADPPKVEERIQSVENGLLRPVSIAGRPVEKFKLTDRMKHYNTPGVSIAVIDHGSIAWARGFGLLDARKPWPVNPDTIFQAASISKPVAATAALHLVQEGKLSLDENVNAYLKSWRVPDNEFTKDQKVTLRRLLSHSAGLTVHGFPGYDITEPMPAVPQILDGVKPANTAPVRVDAAPGSRFNYSGGGFTIVQLLMTDVTGKPFADVMRDVVLEPAGMTHSAYQQPLQPHFYEIAATAHDRHGVPLDHNWHVYPELAAAGLWTTPSDLARFALELARSRKGESNKVLSREMTNLMLTRQIDNVGLGIMLQGHGLSERFQHGGDNAGFHAMLISAMDGAYGAAVMVNSDGGRALLTEILMSIAAAYNWPDYKPRERTVVQLGARQLDAYAGQYTGAPFPVTIRRVEDHLEASLGDFASGELYPESETRFFSLDDALPEVTFAKAADGSVESLSGGGVKARKTK